MIHVIRIRKGLNKLDGRLQRCVNHELNGAETIPLIPAQNECSPRREVQIRSGLKLPFRYLSSSPHHIFFLERSNLHPESLRPTLNDSNSSPFFLNLKTLRTPCYQVLSLPASMCDGNPAYCVEKVLSPKGLKVRVSSFSVWDG